MANTFLPQKAQKFVNVLTGTGYVMRAIDLQAIHHLVVDITTDCTDGAVVGNNIWSALDVLYPFMGNVYGTHKYNLKDPRDLDAAYRLVDLGSPGPVHAYTGVTFNGSSAYCDTKYVPSTAGNSLPGLGIYMRSNVSTDGCADMGVTSTGLKQLIYYIYWQDTHQYNYGNTTATNPFFNPIPPATTQGFWMMSRNNAASATNNVKVFRNGSLLTGYNQGASVLPTNSLYIGTYSNSGTPTFGSAPHRNKEWALGVIMNGSITDTKQSNFYDAVQHFQTILGRQV